MVVLSLALASLLAASDEPRFQMEVGEGDLMRAAIYLDVGHDRRKAAESFLETANFTLAQMNFRETAVEYAVAEGAAPRSLVLFGTADDTRDRACLIEPAGTEGADNSARAIDWCMSFLTAAPVVRLPALEIPQETRAAD